MRACVRCGSTVVDADWRCGRCGDRPEVVGGFLSFAPELAQRARTFDPSLFATLAAIEPESFWFHARNELIAALLRAHFPGARWLLELGCGTGFVLSYLERTFPVVETAGCDVFVEGLDWARRRLARSMLFQADAAHIPYRDHFDVIGAFDILEHVGDDLAVLRAIHGALAPSGIVVLTVPQHRWLWSRADDLAHHERRYDANGLRGKAIDVGFTVERQTSFVMALLPLMLASRLVQRLVKRHGVMAELQLPAVLDRPLRLVMAAERALIRSGLSLPVGGSLALVARKPS